jgi:hypothetical protein
MWTERALLACEALRGTLRLQSLIKPGESFIRIHSSNP